MATIEELNQQLEDAEIEVRRQEQKREAINHEIEDLIKQYKRQLEQHQFASRIAAADQQVQEARRIAIDARRQMEAFCVATNEQISIVGRTVAEWKLFGCSSEPKATGVRGVVEVFKAGDRFIGSRWSQPSIGSLVVRVLKKDGTKSLKCVAFHGEQLPHRWKFENE